MHQNGGSCELWMWVGFVILLFYTVYYTRLRDNYARPNLIIILRYQ